MHLHYLDPVGVRRTSFSKPSYGRGALCVCVAAYIYLVAGARGVGHALGMRCFGLGIFRHSIVFGLNFFCLKECGESDTYLTKHPLVDSEQPAFMCPDLGCR